MKGRQHQVIPRYMTGERDAAGRWVRSFTEGDVAWGFARLVDVQPAPSHGAPGAGAVVVESDTTTFMFDAEVHVESDFVIDEQDQVEIRGTGLHGLDGVYEVARITDGRAKRHLSLVRPAKVTGDV